MSNTYNNLYNLIKDFDCNDTTYFNKYGLQFFISIIYLIVIIYTISYLYINLNIKNIKKNWSKYRCNPAFIPFAGYINNPSNMSSFDYTKLNFDYCSINILKYVTSNATLPISYLQNILFLILKSLSNSFNLMRIILNKIRDNIAIITKNILNRIMNVIIPYISMVINIRDIISKINGIFTSAIYTLYSLFLSLISTLKMIKSVLITVVVTVIIVFILLAISIGWLFPPLLITLPLYIAMGGLLATVVAGISVLLLNSFNVISTSNVPTLPTYCFDKNTIITLKDKSKKFIKDIKLGDVLNDGSIVEALMVSSSNNIIMYKFKNIIVSSKHKIYDKLNGWINIEDHPQSKKIENYNEPYIYCLSTNTKIININDDKFSDWDELDDEDINILKERIAFKKYYKDINKLNCGFDSDTEIQLHNKKKIKIKDIKIGDILYKNNKVLSIIKIKCDKLEFKEYKVNTNIIFKATNNLIFNNSNNVITNKIKSPNICYNIITSKGYFTINNLEINDFINSGIEYYLT